MQKRGAEAVGAKRTTFWAIHARKCKKKRTISCKTNKGRDFVLRQPSQTKKVGRSGVFRKH